MSLESIIRSFTKIKAEIKESKEFDEILTTIKSLRGACVSENIRSVIAKIKSLSPSLSFLNIEQQKIIKEGLVELYEIQTNANHISDLNKHRKFSLPKSGGEFWDRLALPSYDMVYRETERFFPNCLYLPVCQQYLPQLGSSAGECNGFAVEGIRGVLEEGRLFGHIIGDKPIFKPIVSSKKIKTRMTMSLNNTVYFGEKINDFQMNSTLSLSENYIQKFSGIERIKSVTTILPIIYEHCNKRNGGLILTLGHHISDDDGHSIGFVRDGKNRMIVLDANSGCYVFPNDEIFEKWFPWYFNITSYSREYRSVEYVSVVPCPKDLKESKEKDEHKKLVELENIDKQINLFSNVLDTLAKEMNELRSKTPKASLDVTNIDDDLENELKWMRMEIQRQDLESKKIMLMMEKNNIIMGIEEQKLKKILDVTNRINIFLERKNAQFDAITGELLPKRCGMRAINWLQTRCKYYIGLGVPVIFRHVKTSGVQPEKIALRSDLVSSILEAEQRPALKSLSLETQPLLRWSRFNSLGCSESSQNTRTKGVQTAMNHSFDRVESKVSDELVKIQETEQHKKLKALYKRGRLDI